MDHMRQRTLTLVAILLVGLNLRGAIAAVSPVLPEIREELALSAGTAGLLTTLPVLCFAAVSPLAAWLGHRIGLERAVSVGLLGIAAGTVVRVLGGSWVLFVGTLVVGAAMTIGNVLVPAITKRDFGGGAGTVTGVYTATLAGGAALAAALTAPSAAETSWRVALAAWAVLPLAAFAVWAVAAGRRAAPGGAAVAVKLPGSQSGSVWRHPVAWAVAVALGSQSVAFYSITAWLPTLLMDDPGLDLRTAGLAMSLFQILGIPGTLIIPMVATRRPTQVWLSMAVSASWAVMIGGLLVAPQWWALWSVVGGIAQGAGISLAFTVLVLRAHDSATARRLSAMAQLVGYALGALGPFVVGLLTEATGGWTVPLLVLLAVCGLMAGAGLVAGRNVAIGAPSAFVSR